MSERVDSGESSSSFASREKVANDLTGTIASPESMKISGKAQTTDAATIDRTAILLAMQQHPPREVRSPQAKKPLDPRGELYQRILDLTDVVQPEGEKTEGLIELLVTDDETLKLGDTETRLQGNALWVFNALCRTRGEPKTSQELSELGFDAVRENTFSKAMDVLNRNLGKLALNLILVNATLTSQRRVAKTYMLHPLVKLVDDRGAEHDNLDAPTAMVADTASPTSTFDEAMPTEHDPNKKSGKDTPYLRRARQIKAIINLYGQDSYVTTQLVRLQNSGPMSNSMNIVDYFRNYAGRFELLDAAQEVELFTVIEKGLKTYALLDETAAIPPEVEQTLKEMVIAHRTVYLSNLRLVLAIVARDANSRRVPLEDGIQAGNEGLRKAIDRFNYREGVKFSTYATPWIKNELLRAAVQDRVVHIPEESYITGQTIRREYNTLALELNREPTMSELSKKLAMPPDAIRHYIAVGMQADSLDRPLSNDTETTIGASLADKNLVLADPTKAPPMREEIAAIFESGLLSDIEKLALAQAYGLLNYLQPSSIVSAKYATLFQGDFMQLDGLSGEQTGLLMGLSPAGLRSARARAERKVREAVETTSRKRGTLTAKAEADQSQSGH